MNEPSPNGRDAGGRFAKGWQGGPGNPHAGQVARLRSAMLAEITPEDIRALVRQLVDLGKAGNVSAIREVLLRTVGRPVEHDLIERLERLELCLGELEQ